jgi:hypothetical protein
MDGPFLDMFCHGVGSILLANRTKCYTSVSEQQCHG